MKGRVHASCLSTCSNVFCNSLNGPHWSSHELSEGVFHSEFDDGAVFVFAGGSASRGVQVANAGGEPGRVEHRYPSGGSATGGSSAGDSSYHDRELWFKAAVIAVPIAGGFILVLLVLLAVRMLRNDARRHSQMMQMRRHRDVIAKAQLYVSDHFCDKTDHHLCFNSLEKPQRTNMNVKIDMTGGGGGGGYEKLNSSFSAGTSCMEPGKCHSNSTPSSGANDSSSNVRGKSSSTLHTSATQTPAFSDYPEDLGLKDASAPSHSNSARAVSGSSRPAHPHDSVIVWADKHKKEESTVGQVV